MKDSIFNPEQQQKQLSGKIAAGLERLSEVFKVLLWQQAKIVGLSPIQIQILIFIKYHPANLSNVSNLAKEFNVSKPTISDAVKILNKKGLIFKDHSGADQRSYTMQLSSAGQQTVIQTQHFAAPIARQVASIDPNEQEDLFASISTLIYKLTKTGILSQQRMCFGCRFYAQNQDGSYCNLLQKPLTSTDIRIDCLEFETAV